MKAAPRHDFRSSGFSIVECLVAVAILGIAALAASKGTIASYSYSKRSLRQSIATQLAEEKLEEYAATDPSLLTAASGLAEPYVTSGNVVYSRVSTVTVNADASRTVTVVVTPRRIGVGTAVSLQATLALWGNV